MVGAGGMCLNELTGGNRPRWDQLSQLMYWADSWHPALAENPGAGMIPNGLGLAEEH